MIGLCLDWHGKPVSPPAAERFAASLGAGLARPVAQHRDGALLGAALCRTPAEARGWRPTPLPDGGVLLFNGYLDDPDAARRALRVEHAGPAALYAAGFSAWGDSVDGRLGGQFATIIAWPERRRVRCSRSPIDAPPLHVRHDAARVAIASHARALFADGTGAPELDEHKIADSLYLNYGEAERGWFRSVYRVPVGTQVSIDPDRLTATRYYDLAAVPHVRLRRDTDYVAAGQALLLEGTRAALRGSTRPAISLSGGLDSQGVAACAVEILGDRPLLALTGIPEPDWHGADPDNAFGDERPHVAALAALYPTLRTETVDAAGLSFDHKLNAIFLLAGAAPRNTINLHWIHALHARARALGSDVLLSGAMGNLSFSFSGAGAFPGWLRRGHWSRLARELPHVRGGRSFARTFATKALLPFAPDALYRRIMRHTATALPPWCPLNPDHARAMAVAERARDVAHDVSFRDPASSRTARATTIGNSLTESGDLRQAFVLIHDLPMRDPTAYRPLIEFCVGIPDEQFLRDGKRRWLARRMLDGRVPAMVLAERRRGRQAVDWPLRLGRERDALLAELAGLARDPAMASRIDVPRLTEALERWSPDSTPSRVDEQIIQLALPRALATARFIRFVEGTNG